MADGERSLEARIHELEARIAALEARLGAARPVEAPTPVGLPTPPIIARAPVGPRISAALVLGWAGAAALVLAAAYLVRLGIEYGWITPARQMLAVAALGVAMTAGGLALRLGDRPYASLLGAGGVAVLYLAVFGAHLVHHLIGAPAATALAVGVAVLSLALHALYRSGVYVAFALAGSYATPVLVEGRGALVELALYLAVWDLVYCAYAIWTRRRLVVVAALYASLVVFGTAWTELGRPAWETAALFQLFQFVLFVAVTVALSVRLRKPLGAAEALLYFPALLLFYAIEYAILEPHAPALAPWAAVGFLAALYAAVLAARRLLGRPPLASLLAVHGFGAVVVVHAVYIDATARSWRPLVALALAAGLVLLPRLRPALARAWWPYHAAAALLAAAGWLELFVPLELGRGYAADALLLLAYPALLYVLYFERPAGSDAVPRAAALVVGHMLLLAGSALLVEHWLGGAGTTVDRLWLSLTWAAIAVVALAVALARGDRLLARSALGIFLLFGFKVLAFDLDRAAPLVRIGILAVLGVSLYAGGWIYRRVLPPSAPEALDAG